LIKSLLLNLLNKIWDYLLAFVAACIVISILTLILNYLPTGYKVHPIASIRKLITQVAVLQSPPDLQLFSQYPYEYNLKDPRGWIADGEKLEITSSRKTLWLGVWNNEPITVRGVRLILIPPKDVQVAEKDTWESAWLGAQFGHDQSITRYQFNESRDIYSRTGWVIAVPTKFQFPQIAEYTFKYVILSEDWGAVSGKIVIKRKS